MRALKSHGGVAKADLNQPNLEAVKAGASNLIRHIDNLKNGFGLPVVEAAACGTPVASARGSALDEVTPPGAPRFDPRDTDALVALMHDLAQQRRGPADAPDRLQAWARRFDLAAHAQRVDALLQELS